MTTILNPKIKGGYVGVYRNNGGDKTWIVNDPTGKRTFFVTNLSKFVDSINKRRKSKLDKSHLAKVGRGIRTHHKGWTASQVGGELATN
jgi:hypothetical protein|tara:strand:- start:225 stop:491 length:267 start_codon:yes stop_codon:yes gene_type:complete